MRSCQGADVFGLMKIPVFVADLSESQYVTQRFQKKNSTENYFVLQRTIKWNLY